MRCTKGERIVFHVRGGKVTRLVAYRQRLGARRPEPRSGRGLAGLLVAPAFVTKAGAWTALASASAKDDHHWPGLPRQARLPGYVVGVEGRVDMCDSEAAGPIEACDAFVDVVGVFVTRN